MFSEHLLLLVRNNGNVTSFVPGVFEFDLTNKEHKNSSFNSNQKKMRQENRIFHIWTWENDNDSFFERHASNYTDGVFI